jgi:hypothetical protein
MSLVELGRNVPGRVYFRLLLIENRLWRIEYLAIFPGQLRIFSWNPINTVGRMDSKQKMTRSFVLSSAYGVPPASCLLPTAVIAILSSLHRATTLIGVLGTLTVVFDIRLMFFTSSKRSRVETFSATPA